MSGIDERDLPSGTEPDADDTPTAPTERPTGFWDTDVQRPPEGAGVRLADDPGRDPTRRPAADRRGASSVVGGRRLRRLHDTDTDTRGTRSTG